jgi:hypothetical protein
MKALRIMIALAILHGAAQAQTLNDRIVAYLAHSGFSWAIGDFKVEQPDGQPEGISQWNTAKLGPVPDASQLAAAATYWANQQQAKQFYSVLATGLTVTCATGATVCTSDIQGTYAVDENSQIKIGAIYSSIKGGNGLPGGGSTFFFKDTSGRPHPFTAAQFEQFAPAAMNFYYGASVTETQLLAGQAASWPASTVELQ